MKKIILTGGGTAGHVTPNLALIPRLKDDGWEIHYIGAAGSVEETLITQVEGVNFHTVSVGKLRRYFDVKNFSDPFRVVNGVRQATGLIRKLNPNVVFSKGGFVSVPVVYGAKLNGVPVVSHESDMTPGLANRICIPSADKVCCNFPETMPYLPEEKAVLSGSPIRAELLTGDRKTGLDYAHFTGEKPVILVIGGSLGSVTVNNAVRAVLPEILETFDVIHICGKGNLDESLIGKPGYKEYEYVDKPLRHLFACADLMISRAGANSICEILALRKPNILIPLSAQASRGDQILNARSFAKQGFSALLEEEVLTSETLMHAIRDTWENRETYIAKMSESHLNNAVDTIMGLILDCVREEDETE